MAATGAASASNAKCTCTRACEWRRSISSSQSSMGRAYRCDKLMDRIRHKSVRHQHDRLETRSPQRVANLPASHQMTWVPWRCPAPPPPGGMGITPSPPAIPIPKLSAAQYGLAIKWQRAASHRGGADPSGWSLTRSASAGRGTDPRCVQGGQRRGEGGRRTGGRMDVVCIGYDDGDAAARVRYRSVVMAR